MRKVFASLAVAAMLVLAFSMVAAAQEQKSQTWTGWISDSGCAAKGMNADHKACALTCVKDKGAKWVFVNSADKAVHPISNQDAVSEANLGMEVNLTGTAADDGSLHVDSIAAAAKM